MYFPSSKSMAGLSHIATFCKKKIWQWNSPIPHTATRWNQLKPQNGCGICGSTPQNTTSSFRRSVQAHPGAFPFRSRSGGSGRTVERPPWARSRGSVPGCCAVVLQRSHGGKRWCSWLFHTDSDRNILGFEQFWRSLCIHYIYIYNIYIYIIYIIYYTIL